MKLGNKPMIIYFVTKADEIVYIGQTRRGLEARKKQHISLALSGKGSVIGAAIRKHGVENFEWNKHCVYYNQKDLDSAEKFLISKYAPRYNVAPGGQFGIEWTWNKGKKETRPEVLKNISNSAKNRRRTIRGPATPEANKKRVEARTAKLKERSRSFICNETGKVYKLVVEAAKDMNITANGIYAVLNPKHRMKSYKGFTFKYLE